MTQRRGFTLIELIIALALTATMLAAITFAFGQSLRTWKKVARESEKAQIENIVLERICRDLRAASAIQTNSSSREIDLKVGGETINYAWQDLKIKKKRGSSVTYLTSERDTDPLSFFYPSAGVVGVRIGEYSTQAALRNR